MSETMYLMERAGKLPIEEKVRLAEFLLASVPTDEEEEAFIAELNRRCEAQDRGEAVLIPAEKVFAEILARRK